jgi:hypothetical protein
VTPDDYSVAIMVVPAAMQSAVAIEFDTRAAVITVAIAVIMVAIIVAVAADAETETLSVRHCRSRNSDCRQRGENA